MYIFVHIFLIETWGYSIAMLVYQRVNSSLDFCFQKALLVQHFLCGRRYQSPVTQMFASGFLPFSGDAVWIFFRRNTSGRFQQEIC